MADPEKHGSSGDWILGSRTEFVDSTVQAKNPTN
jgi:hypothetical protein